MSDKLTLSLRKLKEASARLEEAIAAPESPLQADAVIQRFEFTFELLWRRCAFISSP